MIEKDFDIPFLANLALREKQIQQNYRPVIAVHKWFARRPGTLFRGLLLSEFGDGELQDLFYQSNCLDDITVADPFMGGGTPVIEANRLGCSVIGCDINPMACWIVERELADLNLEDYQAAARDLIDNLKGQLGGYYYTRCNICGNEQVPVKYYLWVKTLACEDCGQVFDLFPGYILASNNRHPNYVLICSSCGQLNEVEDHNNPGVCADCGQQLVKSGPASRNRCLCPNCGTSNRYPRPELGPLQHRMVAIEYYCPHCKPSHRGRFFKRPDQEDLDNYIRAKQQFLALDSIYVPRDFIPPGDESTRLHRWGYNRYQELFNSRQLLGLELSSRLIMALPEGEVKSALATNLSDLLRYQNMLCRYDTRALKSLDIFSVHGFPVSLLQCESNLLGIVDEKRVGNIGSGGWTNIVDKYLRAKEYCQKPFEIKHVKGKKIQVPISGEKIGRQPMPNCSYDSPDYQLYCQSSTDLNLAASSLDAVITDPPYFGNVQYAELMDFCYVWLRKLAGTDYAGFGSNTTRDENELTGNTTMKRGSQHFLEGISQVFQNMARALKPGAPFVFTYHHNDIKAYLPVAVALLDAGLVCSASLPCPGEMGASIHINGTGSSIIDTVFVCRSTGVVSSRTIVGNPKDIALLVERDLKQLALGGVKFSQGDMRCITYGHLIRLAVWNLRKNWNSKAEPGRLLAKVEDYIETIGDWPAVKEHLLKKVSATEKQNWIALEENEGYGGEEFEISF